jgi:hypothetical protein
MNDSQHARQQQQLGTAVAQFSQNIDAAAACVITAHITQSCDAQP